MSKRSAFIVTLIASYCFVTNIPLSVAALGDAPSPPPPNAVTASKIDVPLASTTSASASPNASYSIIETHLSAGDILREYMSIEKRVFAVTWSGRHMPDMAILLGSYFGEYQTAMGSQNPPRNPRDPVVIVLGNLTVYISGRMGNFSIHAWLPHALPIGMLSDSIR
ncbi:DUF2844 domain-containing protein [Burkholderia ubonensis]|uniref:DUF2844 domain-containing protein n=1 Tax=Burkholderia ubonensis TaxID=101571 RepID=UPI0009B2FB1D|nr:DUF2844 domain-containing protein [Burkholderia ubonensis]